MLITNVKIIPIKGDIIPNGFIHIADSKIAALGNMNELTIQDENTLNMSGLTAYPGFIDGHCHLGLFGDGMGIEGEDGNEDTDPITPHLKAIDGINPFDRGFIEARESGITSVVTGPGSANPLAGSFCAIKTVGKIIDNMIINPNSAMKFALGENPKMVYHGKGQTPATRMATAALIREQLVKAQKYMEAKQNAEEDEELDEPEYDHKCEALIPLLKREIKAHIHAHRGDDIATAMRLIKEFNLDGVFIHCTEGHLLKEELGSIKSDIVCGPIIGTRSKPELANMTTKNCAILNNSGARVSICTDHPEVPIEYLCLSAAIAVENGMEHTKALEAITINPAIQANIAHRVGSLKVGKDADIVLFDKDPLTISAKPKMVIIDGKIVFTSTLL